MAAHRVAAAGPGVRERAAEVRKKVRLATVLPFEIIWLQWMNTTKFDHSFKGPVLRFAMG